MATASGKRAQACSSFTMAAIARQSADGRINAASHLLDWVRLPEAQMRCLFTNEPASLSGALRTLLEASAQTFSWVSVAIQGPMKVGAELDAVVQALAEGVLAQYPVFLQTAAAKLAERSREADSENVNHSAIRDLPNVSSSWLHRTAGDCASGKVPRYRELPLAFEAKQLALCLDPERLTVLLSVTSESLPGAHLLGIARAVEWLASCTHASIVTVLHESLEQRAELDAINYHSLHWQPDAASTTSSQATEASAVAGSSTTSPVPPEVPSFHVLDFGPVIGRPHPLSTAEKCLAEAIDADPELRGKFEWNQPVVTRAGTRPIVDLLWRAGHLVVEIDGFAFHSSREAFARDRHRDWELLVSGYRVVRIAATEVLEQTARSLEKLRMATSFIQESL